VPVDDEHFVGVRPDGVDDFPNQAFLVPSGNDDGNALGSQNQGKGLRAEVRVRSKDLPAPAVRIGELVLYDQ